MKIIKTLLLSAGIASTLCMTALASDQSGYGADLYYGDVVSEQWININNKWYRTDLYGITLKNTWFQDIDGKWYYLGGNGVMLENTTTPDGYFVDPSGVWIR